MGFMQALSPVADAYSLRRLAGNRSLYGRERAWGSFSWGLSAVILGALMTVMDLTLAYMLFTAILTFATLFILRNSPSDLTEIAPNAITRPGGEDVREQVFVIEDEEVDKEMQIKPMIPEEKLPGSIKADPRVEQAADLEEPSETTALKEKEKIGVSIFLRNAELSTLVFLFVMLCLEMGQALTETLEFLFITEELKSSPLLCGVSVAVGVVLEVPLLMVSEPLLRRIGILYLILFAIAVFCVRVTAFTFITPENAWWILGVEPLAGIYVALLKMSSVSFMSQAAPKGREAVAMGSLNVFRCMGQVLGTVIGSYVLQNFGATVLYRSFGILVVIAGFIVIWVFRLKRRAAAAAEAIALPPVEGVSQKRTSNTDDASKAPRGSISEIFSPPSVQGKKPITDSEIDVIKSEIALLELHKS
jgi:hypothetical protein